MRILVKRTRNALIALSLIIISSLFSFVLVEVILRALKTNSEWAITSDANILRDFSFEYNISGLYPSESKKVFYHRDKNGLRDDCESSSEIKILTVGGSTTDQRYIPFKSTFQKVLQDKLWTEFGAFGCVSNAGVDGHTTWGHNFAFQYWFPLIKNLSPDYVIFYVGLNDAFLTTTNSPNIGYDTLSDKKTLKGFLKQFETIRKLMPLYRYIKTKSLGFTGHTPIKYSAKEYVIADLNPNIISISAANSLAFKRRFKKLLKQTKLWELFQYVLLNLIGM